MTKKSELIKTNIQRQQCGGDRLPKANKKQKDLLTVTLAGSHKSSQKLIKSLNTPQTKPKQHQPKLQLCFHNTKPNRNQQMTDLKLQLKQPPANLVYPEKNPLRKQERDPKQT